LKCGPLVTSQVRREKIKNQFSEWREFVIRRLIVVASILFAFSVLPANAGTVSGKIRLARASSAGTSQSAGENESVVIWLEGQDAGKPPENALKISQRNLQFSPDFLVAVKGQKIDMPNDDDVAHNVFSFTGMSQFNLGIYAKGEFRSVKLEQVGIVDVFCSIHRQMHARIFVVPTRYFASSLPGQSFSINDVPPGRYVLKAWHERSRMMERTVIVPKAGGLIEDVVLESAPATATSTATSASAK
jgi:plastocyanin